MARKNPVVVGLLLFWQLFVLLYPLCQSVSGKEGIPPPTAKGVAKSPVLLYGRIEELSTQSGAKLPLTFTRQAGKLDLTTPPLTGRARTFGMGAKFPEAWQGGWTGTLKIHSNQFAPIGLELDREETLKLQELMAPGKVGSVSFNFNRSDSQLYLEPTEVVFSVPMSQSRHSVELQELSRGMSASSSALNAQVTGLLLNSPYYYALEMGNVVQGVGVTGNALHSEVLKNDVKELAGGIIEQDLVCYNSERNPKSGKTQQCYSETVIRFYPQGENQMYVQVASVTYLSDGSFKAKIMLYGNVERTKVQPATPYAGAPFLLAPPSQNGNGADSREGSSQNDGLNDLFRKLMNP